jgi:hypothetical protein
MDLAPAVFAKKIFDSLYFFLNNPVLGWKSLKRKLNRKYTLNLVKDGHIHKLLWNCYLLALCQLTVTESVYHVVGVKDSVRGKLS